MIGGTDEEVRVRLTVVDPARVGARADVEVAAPPGTRLDAVADRLLTAVGCRRGAPGEARAELFVDGAAAGSAVVGLPPVLDGAIVTTGRAGGPAGRAAGTFGGLTEVHVVAGPDAGLRHPLAAGATPLGRGPGTGLRIADPDVSRAHAEIVASGAVVRVRDLGSTNGTRIAGGSVDGSAVPWPAGLPLRIGASVLVLRTQDGDPAGGGGPASVVPDGRGRLLVNPAPRLPPPPVTGLVTFPEAPPEHTRARLPWVAVLLPLALSVPLAWWLHQAIFLAFALLSPLMMVGQYLSDRRDRRGERALALERYRAGTDGALVELESLLAAERARLLLDHPDPAAVGAAAAGPLQRLWERRATDHDAAVLRLGLGVRRSAVEVRGPAPEGADPPRLRDVPLTLDLADPSVGGVAGLAGPRREVLALARCLVGQAVVARSPDHLRVVVLTPGGDVAADWEWAAWLPHAAAHLPPLPDADDQDPVGDGRPEPQVLLVLDGAERLRRDPHVAALLARAGRRVLALCLDDDPVRLPAECGATVRVWPAGTDPGALLAVRGEEPRALSPDLVSPSWAERLARDLARLADATPARTDRGLPVSVRLLDLLAAGAAVEPRSSTPGATSGGARAGAPSPDRVAAAWARARTGRTRATTAVAGVTAAGPWHLDLARHGPHALIAGTTSAGKSELLTALVAALAVTHPPDRLHLLLVDYKGGTAFGPLGDLPHAAGVLTDLDEHLARRALSSLRAELRRRERLLREAGAADIDGYERTRAEFVPAMPRLVIVVDEFRVFAEELPDLLEGLVRVAVVGRSLGVHLVLATQRPAGVVTAEIRANVNLRIALRVRDRTDSDDVVEAPDAALLPSDRPGRGLFRAGAGPLVEFQAARATGSPRPDRLPPAQVRQLRRTGPVATAWHPLPAPMPDGARPTGGTPGDAAPGGTAPRDAAPGATLDDLALVVATCRAAATRAGIAPARAPWLPPLPDVVRRTDVARLLTGLPAGPPRPASPVHGSDRAPAVLTFGVVDLPHRQSRDRLRWPLPGEGHLAIVGAPGSGRTGAALAVVGAACRAPEPVHVHIVDGAGRMAGVLGPAMPSRLGTVVPVTDTERAARLISLLAHRTAAGTVDAEPGPPTILVVDGWEQVLDAWLPVEHGRLVDDLVRLARDGAGSGLRLAVTGGRALLTGAVASVLTERLLLRAADPTDLVLAGVPASALPGRMPPGRAVRVLPGAEVVEAQVVLDDLTDLTDLTGPTDLTDPTGPTDLTDLTGPTADGPPPLRLAALPGRLGLSRLLAALAERPGGTRAVLDGGTLPVGMGGDDAAPVGPPAAGPGWLVAGSPGSGRSSTLATAAHVLRDGGRAVVVIAAPGGPLSDETGDRWTTLPSWAVRAGTADLLASLDTDPTATLVVDDLSVLPDHVEGHLLARLDGVARGTGDPAASTCWPSGAGPHVLAACTPSEAAVAFRGLAARLRTTGSGILLTPIAPGDGEAFGMRVPARSGAPPGRALVLAAGRPQAVQVAVPE